MVPRMWCSYTRRMQYIPVGALGLLAFLGCSSLEAPVSRAPAYVHASDNYRAFASVTGLSDYLRSDSDNGPLLAARHGGLDAGYPENALPSFERALRHGPIMIHCDVRLTQDGIPVLLRDANLERTTTGIGPVSQHPLSSVRSMLLKDAYNVITPFRVPTLEEAITWARGRTVLLLDVMDVPDTQIVLESVQRLEAQGHVVLVAQSPMDALHMHGREPNVMISLYIDHVGQLNALLAGGLDASRLIAAVSSDDITPDLVEFAHSHGIRVMLGGSNEIDYRAQSVGTVAYHAVFDRGVGLLLTGELALASRAVEEYESR